MADFVNYALVVRTTTCTSHMQDSDLEEIKNVWIFNKEYYRIERWFWIDTPDGHILHKTEVVDVN